MTHIKHATWIEIDLAAIENNARYSAKRTGKDVLAVVKNDAYGHGVVEASNAVLTGGAKWLAVARIGGLENIRSAGIDTPTLVFGGATFEETEDAVRLDATLPMYDPELAKAFSAKAVAMGKKLKVHLKIDTGMGRFGVFPHEAAQFAQFIEGLEGLEIDGAYSHYAIVNDGTRTETHLQLKRFKEALAAMEAVNIEPRKTHMCSSGVIMNYPQSYFNMVRAGGILYGLGGLEDEHGNLPTGLMRAFSWKAKLMSCKRFPAGWGVGYENEHHTSEGEIIGVVPVGHGDGYRNAVGNQVLIDGQRVPVVGKVCMDQFMISLPKMYPIGTEITLIGVQGNENISNQEIARRWKIATSATTNVSKRVERIYN